MRLRGCMVQGSGFSATALSARIVAAAACHLCMSQRVHTAVLACQPASLQAITISPQPGGGMIHRYVQGPCLLAHLPQNLMPSPSSPSSPAPVSTCSETCSLPSAHSPTAARCTATRAPASSQLPLPWPTRPETCFPPTPTHTARRRHAAPGLRRPAAHGAVRAAGRDAEGAAGAQGWVDGCSGGGVGSSAKVKVRV